VIGEKLRLLLGERGGPGRGLTAARSDPGQRRAGRARGATSWLQR
jgi:hypothetical protein